jgi:hypothetical protein
MAKRIVTAREQWAIFLDSLQMNETAPWFKPLQPGEELKPHDYDEEDPYNFTGSPETQHHHRTFDEGGWDAIRRRKEQYARRMRERG